MRLTNGGCGPTSSICCRYEAPREEDKVKPFSYVGFGGGRHGCMGTNFAYLQVRFPTHLLSINAPLLVSLAVCLSPGLMGNIWLGRSRRSGRSCCATLRWRWWTPSLSATWTAWWSAPSPAASATAAGKRRSANPPFQSCVLEWAVVGQRCRFPRALLQCSQAASWQHASMSILGHRLNRFPLRVTYTRTVLTGLVHECIVSGCCPR